MLDPIMNTQFDSLQISQLKSLALGLHHEPGNFNNVSCIVKAPRSPPATDSVSESNIPQNLNTKTPKRRHVSPPITNLGSPSSSAPSNPPQPSSHSPPQSPCAVDAVLPNTIPDSARLKMTSAASEAEDHTQPISQRVLDEFARKSKLETAVKGLLGTCDGTCNTHESSVCSYRHGQPGFVDLIGGLEQPLKISPEEPSPENDEDELDPLSPVVEVRAELYPESKRFQQPKTPATNGKKRNYAGEIIHRGDSSSKPPINPFAGNMMGLDSIMDPSQAFKATQAASSPLTHVQYSDTLSERPSPNLYSIERPTPTRIVSSPPLITNSRMVRAVTEPQTTYISMQESQEKRDMLARRSGMELGRSGAVSSDEDFESDDSQARKRRNRRRIDLKVRGQFIGVTAPLRPVSSGRGIRGTQKPFQTSDYNYRPGREVSEALVISDDLPAEGNVSEDETEHEEDKEDLLAKVIDELADDNKENIDVPMTISRPSQKRRPGIGLESTPSQPCENYTLVSSTDNSKPRTDKHENIECSSNQQNGSVSQGTQTSAIADSQPAPHIEGDPQCPEDASGQHMSSSPSDVPVPKNQDICILSTPLPNIASQRNQTVGNLVNSAPGFQKSLHNTPLTYPGGDRSDTCHQNQQALEDRDNSKEPQAHTERGTGDFSRVQAVTGPSENHARLKVQRGVIDSSPGGVLSALPNTIPETSSTAKRSGGHTASTRSPAAIESVHSNTKSPSKTLLNNLQPHILSGSTPFETAQETILNSPSKLPYVNQKHQYSHQISSPSAKVIPPKSLAQIAADPSPRDAIGEIDVDINLLTSEDIEYQNIIEGSSPTRRRSKMRRGNRRRVMDIAEQKADEFPMGTGQNAVSEHINPDVCTTDELAVDYSASEKDMIENELVSSMLTKASEGASTSTPPKVAPNSQDGQEKIRPLIQNNPRLMAGEKKKAKASPITRSALPVPLQEEAISPFDSVKNRNLGPPFVASDRVFAHFNGNVSAYYPATCIGVESGDKPRYSVCFDDYQIDKVGGFNVRRLELRVGDPIKVANSKKETYIVKGFADRYTPPAQPNPDPSKRNSIIFCDVFGHQTVIVSLKQPKSLLGDAPEQRSVPVKDVYLTQTMWGKYKDRPFIPVVPDSSFELQTSSDQPSTPSTPASQDCRTKTSCVASPHSATSISSTAAHLFSNTIFAVTFASESTIAVETRENITEQILSNGGRIVEGFEKLFDIPTLKLTSSSKQSSKDSTNSAFRLTPTARGIGFTCVISDKHCRKAKYVQALALGIPCLATRWVSDCISKQRILPCEPYLLAAGESEYLRGAIRSRILKPLDPDTATLSQIVANGPKFLAGKSILLIMSKAEEQTMRFYPLFTHALGARRILRALSLESAAKAITKAQADGERWDFVYSHDHDKKSRGDDSRRRIEKYLLGTASTSGANRKQARGEDRWTRVVGNEFLIQSLILGQLAD